MRKWIKRIFLTLVFLVFVLIIAFAILFKLAFGPSTNTKNIDIGNNKILVCKETYSSDMAAEFYDVDFSLKNKNGSETKLGAGNYFNKEWHKNIHFYSIGDWYILPVSDYNYSKIIMVNSKRHLNKDTILSPLNLRYNNSWKAMDDDIPSGSDGGSSSVDTLTENKLLVTYEYRIGEEAPFKFYKQKIKYLIDTNQGILITQTVLDRTEVKRDN